MENSHPFPKHTKASRPSNITRAIAVVAFVLIIAGLVFYFRMTKNRNAAEIPNTPSIEQTDNIVGDTDRLNTPEAIDLSMVEDDLNQTEKGIKTIDNFENF